MMSLFRELFIDSDWLGKLLGVLFIVAVLLLGVTVFVVIDKNMATELHNSTGIIREKVFIPSSTSVVIVNKSVLPQHTPENYLLAIYLESEKSTATVSVSADVWEKSNIGDKLDAQFVYGRLSHDIYIKSIR